ncbi:MAG: hypothetical protein ABSA12_11725 [Verrucomicrobiia bacterium]
MNGVTHRVLSLAPALAALTLILSVNFPQGCFAQGDFTWTNKAAAGIWQDSHAWVSNGVANNGYPGLGGPTDVARFTNAATYAITLTASVTDSSNIFQNVSSTSATVTLNVAGFQLNTSYNFTVGDIAGAQTTVYLSSPATSPMALEMTTNDLNVGGNGHGALIITNGHCDVAAVDFGHGQGGAGGVGTLILSGPNTILAYGQNGSQFAVPASSNSFNNTVIVTNRAVLCNTNVNRGSFRFGSAVNQCNTSNNVMIISAGAQFISGAATMTIGNSSTFTEPGDGSFNNILIVGSGGTFFAGGNSNGASLALFIGSSTGLPASNNVLRVLSGGQVYSVSFLTITASNTLDLLGGQVGGILSNANGSIGIFTNSLMLLGGVVSNQGTVQGYGTVLATLDVTSNGVLATSNTVASLVFSNNVNLLTNAIMQVSLGSPAGTFPAVTASNLTIQGDGTLNITAAGGFGPGTYTLFAYGGTLSYQGWTIGSVPSSSFTYTISTNSVGQMNLIVSCAGSYSVATSSSPAAGGTTSGGGTVNCGSNVTVCATPNSCYGFVNWTQNGTVVSTSACYSFTATSNETLVANFSLNSDTITTTASPAIAGTASGGGTFNCGSNVTVTATANACYQFVNWTEGGTVVSTSASYTFTASSNETLTANFTPTTYMIGTGSSPTGGGSTSGGGTVSCGSNVTVTATANACYQFVNWTEGGTVVSTSASYTFTAGANRTLVANFSQVTYTVGTSSSPLDGGWTTGGGVVNCGSNVTVCASPNTCYQFVDWTESGSQVSTSMCYSFTATTNRTLVATFAPVAGTPLNYYWSTIAGTVTSTGSADGTNNAARFYNPQAIAVDSSDNVFVADTDNSTIRKLTPVGTNWVVTTIAGVAGSWGSTDGTNNAARFEYPLGIAVDSSDNVYVADSGNSTIRKLTPVGTNWVVTTIAGVAGSWGSTDGTNNAARFNYPEGITVDSSDNVYVADTDNSTIRKLTPVGTNWVVTTITGMASSKGGAGWFDYPTGIAVDHSDNVFVADRNYSIIQELTPVGANWALTTVGGTQWTVGSADGTNNAALFYYPAGIAVDSSDNVYVADTDNSTIRRGALLSSSPSYIVATSDWPTGAGSDSGGGIVACGSNVTLCATTTGCYTFGNWTEDGNVVSTSPCYEFIAESNRVLVANFIAVYSYNILLTTWGTNEDMVESFDQNGNENPLFANLGSAGPLGMVFDSQGNLYVANYLANTIQKFDTTGNGSIFASSGLSGPAGLAFNGDGNLYVANMDGNTIVKFDAYGNGTVFANSGLDGPIGLAFDSSGNLYVANYMGNTIVKFDPSANRSVFANLGLDGPAGLAFDSGGNLYVANYLGSSIEKITPNGHLFSFYESALLAPFGLVFDCGGNLFATAYDSYSPAILEFDSDGNEENDIELDAEGWGIAVQLYPASTVNDTIPDTWRAQYFGGTGSTTNASSCATCDADGTSQDNLFKYVAGLNPTSPASVFVLQIANVPGVSTQMNLIYNPIAFGRTYTVQYCTNLVGGVYTKLTGYGGPTTNNVNTNQVTVTDLSATQTQKFYRVNISLP